MGLPLGLIAAVAVLGTAVVSVILLESGIAQRRGGLIAVGVLLGAFWLMFLAQTVATVSRQRRHGDPPDDQHPDSEPDRAQASSRPDDGRPT